LKLSVVIPAYNEADNLPTTITEVIRSLEHAGCATGWEIIVVDDHSEDLTYNSVANYGHPAVRCIRLSRRSGSHTAIRAGLVHSAGDAILVLSADGQDDPSVISNMLAKWHEGVHVVWALRKVRKERLGQKFFALAFYEVIKRLGTTDPDKIDMARADFFLLDRSAAQALNSCQERNTSLFGLLEWIGFRTDFVEYERRPRRAGKGKWSFRGRIGLAWDWITGFSGLPLRLIAIFGALTATIGFLYAIFLVYYRLTNPEVPSGFAETVVLILVLSGMQMFMLGVIGEYLWRNIEQSRQRPNFFVEKRTDKQ